MLPGALGSFGIGPVLRLPLRQKKLRQRDRP
jgi:hypothetical protein